MLRSFHTIFNISTQKINTASYL